MHLVAAVVTVHVDPSISSGLPDSRLVHGSLPPLLSLCCYWAFSRFLNARMIELKWSTVVMSLHIVLYTAVMYFCNVTTYCLLYYCNVFLYETESDLLYLITCSGYIKRIFYMNYYQYMKQGFFSFEKRVEIILNSHMFSGVTVSLPILCCLPWWTGGTLLGGLSVFWLFAHTVKGCYMLYGLECIVIRLHIFI